MTMPSPSSDWTHEERLQLIAYLAEQLRNYSQDKPLVRSTLVFLITERIDYVAGMTPKFLEGNRDQFLEPFEETVKRYVRP